VTGKVTYNGKPFEHESGLITFQGPDGISVSAKIEKSGTFLAKGVCVGENKVAVSYTRPIPKAGKRRPSNINQGLDPDKSQTESPFLTPESYAVPETSGLSVVVAENTVYEAKLEGPEIP
jgi:hypothetical protein